MSWSVCSSAFTFCSFQNETFFIQIQQIRLIMSLSTLCSECFYRTACDCLCIYSIFPSYELTNDVESNNIKCLSENSVRIQNKTSNYTTRVQENWYKVFAFISGLHFCGSNFRLLVVQDACTVRFSTF